MSDGSIHTSGYLGYMAGAGVLLTGCGLLALPLMPLSMLLLLAVVMPALVHSAVLIHVEQQRMSLPWEDQFAAVIVSAVMQFPLWMISLFVGFLSGAFVAPQAAIDSDPLEESLAFWFFGGVATLLAYAILFAITILLLHGSLYRDDPTSRTLSLRDAKPIHPPM